MASKSNNESTPPITPSPVHHQTYPRKLVFKEKWWVSPKPDNLPPLSDAGSLSSGPISYAERLEIEAIELSGTKLSTTIIGPREEEPLIKYKGYKGSERLPPRRNFLYPWAPLSEKNLTQYGLHAGNGYYSIAHRHAMVMSNGNPKALRAIMAMQEAYESPPPPEPYNLAGFTGLEHKERIFRTNTVIDPEAKTFNPETDPHGHVIGLRDCRPRKEILEGCKRHAEDRKSRNLSQQPDIMQRPDVLSGGNDDEAESNDDDEENQMYDEIDLAEQQNIRPEEVVDEQKEDQI